MRTSQRTGIAAVLSALLVLAGAAAAADQGSSAFVERFVAAVNSGDRQSLTALLHPGSRACLSDDNREFFEYLFAQDLKRAIPEDYRLSVERIAADAPLPFEEVIAYPVRPSHLVQIDFQATPERQVILVRHAHWEDGTWWYVLACPKPEALAMLRARREE